MRNLSIVIMAAGKGTRMKSPLAKVLHPISGKPMLYHSVKAAKALSDDIIVVTYHQADAVEAMLSGYFEGLTFHRQDLENFPGTGGALMGVKPKHDKVIVLNGDMPLMTPDAITRFLSIDAPIVMSVIRLANPSGYGRVVIVDGAVERIVEQKDCTPQELAIDTVNAGVYAFDASILSTFIPQLSNANAQKEYYLTDVIALAKKAGHAIAPLYVEEELFKGVNSKVDLCEAEIIMQRRIKNSAMLNGVTMHLSDTIYIEEGVTFEGECELEAGVILKGKTHIERSIIKAHSVVEDSTLIDSDVGPMARIRPASRIIDTHIGNFVEVKKSTLTGVKAGHLSYLGDATIDTGTNIGAGTITCNYDGKKKYETIIGKNVFVGSDSQLIAPITIEDDVMIAAGTTLPSGRVESGVLVLSRAPVKTVKGFYQKFFGKK
ncbi:MAG: bifunctional N-acetylglucosamine-1-phosphate uridyltransferase/glucosamine-1-phosphate acetyltransferase [Sulfuricurvum sp. PC08-66]|nr:MAG: bifunctional N-acetylglucosamine-1-phosphate uridyltransferase/glucosamine-1-phosphate acetyltransferase [Sulfuricurvum sp. PC08-66]